MYEIDDLTVERCLDCGTDRELEREPSLLLDGRFYGPIRCADCLARVEG